MSDDRAQTEPDATPPPGAREPDEREGDPRARLTLGSGGYALLLALGLSGGVVAMRVSDFSGEGGGAAAAQAPAAYAPWLLPPERVAEAAPRHALPPLDEPRTLSTAEIAEYRIGRRGKLLVPGDLVVGVERGGEAVAYPLRVLEWHEVVNHTVAGAPLAVTYNPLCASVVVVDRRPVAADGARAARPLRFGASGLLAASNLLLADLGPHAAGEGESLWSQLQARAVAGPAAARGERLEVVPFQLVPWGAWVRDHPQTRVLVPDEARKALLKRDPYRSYYGSDELRFPVEPLPPPEAGLPLKERVLAVRAGGERRVIPLSWAAARADTAGLLTVTVGGVSLEVTVHRADAPHTGALTARAPGGEPLEAIPSFWFAWYAARPDEAQRVGE